MSASGAPGGRSAPRGGGGASHACSIAQCGFDSQIPIEAPAYALVSGTKAAMEIECSRACRGGGVLLYPRAPSARHRQVLARFRFQLNVKGAATLEAKLTPAGRRVLAGKRRLIASVTIVFVAGHSRPTTYVTALDLTRVTPAAAAGHRKASLLLLTGA